MSECHDSKCHTDQPHCSLCGSTSGENVCGTPDGYSACCNEPISRDSRGCDGGAFHRA